jgi:riboflavin kinase/FMN adenylyltransferase
LKEKYQNTTNKTVATIGFFDGVHLGHRFLLDCVCENAAKKGLTSLALTFDMHPRAALNTDFQPKLLTLFPEKMALLQQTGIDKIEVLPFTRELSEMSAAEFLEKVLHHIYNVKKLVIGHDHRFGHHRAEGFEEYKKYGEKLGIEIEQTPPLVDGDVTVSSSVIRRLLENGDVAAANHFLGYPYALSGEVIRGNQIGRTLGFPTANILPNPLKLVPKTGIYAVKIEVRGNTYNGMLNIGFRPTVSAENQLNIEANIFDFSADIYGETIKIVFLQRIRDERKFDGLNELAQQIEMDKRLIAGFF